MVGGSTVPTARTNPSRRSPRAAAMTTGRPATGRRRAIASWLVAAAIAGGGCLPAAIRPTPAPTPTPTPVPTAPPTPTPTPGPPTPTPGPTFAVYKVRRGDTLTSLAHKFKTTARSIAYWNRDAYPSLDPESVGYSPDRLEVGWVLRVMPGRQYVPPPDDGETGIEVTPTPDDEEYDPEPSLVASPGP
jgi:nucleoid-associated protein YgaU